MSDRQQRARELCAELDHPLIEVRKKAADALVDLGADAEPALTALLQISKDLKARRRVLLILSEIDAPKAIPVLMDYVLDRPSASDDSRALAMRAMMKSLRPKHRKHCFDVFVELRRDDDPMVRSVALEGLAKLADARATRFLDESAKNDPEAHVRENAGRLLATFVPKDLSPEEGGLVYTDEQLMHKIASRDAWQRDMGIAELIKRGDGFNRFVDAIRSPHALARQSGIVGLGAVGDPRGFEILYRLVENADVTDDERARALRAMGRIPVPPSFDQEKLLRTMERHLNNKEDVFISASALGVIAKLDHPDALSLVSQRLHHKDAWIRDASAAAISNTVGPRHKPLLHDLRKALFDSGTRTEKHKELTGDWLTDEFSLQQSLLQATNRIAESGGSAELALVGTIVPYLAHPREEVRREARSFLDKMGQRPGDLSEIDIQGLLQHLDSMSRATRSYALGLLDRTLPRGANYAGAALANLAYQNDPELLGELIPLLARTKHPEAEQALGRLARDPRPEIAKQAQKALLDTPSGTLQ